jgi:hypothetical protein
MILATCIAGNDNGKLAHRQNLAMALQTSGKNILRKAAFLWQKLR